MKDGSSRFENTVTQPLRSFRAFNKQEIITEGWYPAFPSHQLKARKIKSYTLLSTRLVVYRGASGQVTALDAFCPHMGADLATGRVIEDDLECYFHRWKYGTDGRVKEIPSQDPIPQKACLSRYPVEEKYGYIWIFAGLTATHPVPEPSAVQAPDGWRSIYLGAVTLHAHHHVMMTNGIDMQHFATVHNLDVKFRFSIHEQNSYVYDWHCEGELPAHPSWKVRLGRWLTGGKISYHARFAGGSIATLTYGPGLRFRGKKRALPTFQILWGCEPLVSGISRVHIFILQPNRRGFFGSILTTCLQGLTIVLLQLLRDDDEKAFPHMRFNPTCLSSSDVAVSKLIALLDKLPISIFSQKNEA